MGGGGEGVLRGRGRARGGGGGDEEIKCQGKDAGTSVLWSVSCSLLPNNGRDIAKRPSAVY